MADQQKNKLSAFELLSGRYPAKEWALMGEVSNSSGFGRSGSADFIAVNYWPSRGLAIHGIEVKANRNDWLNELKKPSKQEDFFQYCDYFWLLTLNDGVAKPEEIPDAWGWMHSTGRLIKTMKNAPKLSPQPLTKDFAVCMLKRAADRGKFVHVDSLENEINARVDQRKDRDRSNAEMFEKMYKDLKKNVDDFESASGLRIKDSWTHPKETGEAVRFITNGGLKIYSDKMKALGITAHSILHKIESELKLVDAIINRESTNQEERPTS